MLEPVVTVCCSTYNQEPFITQALDGFVMQKTTFPFEILINDDASSDSTLKIIQKYAATYSNIKILTHEKNQWGEGMRNGTFFGFEPFVYNLMPEAKGKYLAFCEGDDFWTDPLKLQKQFDYMESHPECSMCYHSYATLCERVVVERTNDKIGKYYTSKELFSVPDGIASSTKIFRNIYSDNTKDIIQHFSGDYLFTSYMGLFGSCGYVSGVKNSIYRLHKGGVWTGLNREVQKLRYLEMLENLYNLHLKYGSAESAEVRKSYLWDKSTFGIILPTYKRRDNKTPGLLKQALDSIFSQTYDKFKLYLIGDNYEDESELTNIVSQYPAEKIHYENLPIAYEREKYSNDPKALWCSGGVFASNYAISKAEQDHLQYICFIDHDDKWLPNHLQILHEAIEETGAKWLCTKSEVNKVDYIPRIVTDESMIDFLPKSEGVIKSSSSFDIRTIPLRFRDVLSETGKPFPADADLWKRMNSFISKHNLKSVYLNTLSCIYISGGIVSPFTKVISWRTEKARPRKLSWRDKIAMATAQTV